VCAAEFGRPATNGRVCLDPIIAGCLATSDLAWSFSSGEVLRNAPLRFAESVGEVMTEAGCDALFSRRSWIAF